MSQRPALIFVYNADSGLFNSVADAAHKVLSPATYACNLCQVTWGWFTERPAWRAFVAGLEADCRFLHRDEFRARFPGQAIALPAVLRRDGDRLAVCIDAATLNAVTDLDALMALVRDACSGHAP